MFKKAAYLYYIGDFVSKKNIVLVHVTCLQAVINLFIKILIS